MLPIFAMLLCVIAVLPQPVRAGTPAPPDAWTRICFEAGASAARAHGVPASLMAAIAMVESGRWRDGHHAPWPWALNVEGQGRYLSDRAALERAATTLAYRHASFDVGCFQVNHRWHGEAFRSPAAMADPTLNAGYAAQFLAALATETGDWLAAAGYYHSRTPHLADAYRRRVRAALARIDPGEGRRWDPPNASRRTVPGPARIHLVPGTENPSAARPLPGRGSLVRQIDGAAGPLRRRIGSPIVARADRAPLIATGVPAHAAAAGGIALSVPRVPTGRLIAAGRQP